VLIGGTSMEPQKRALAADPHVIIVTPGRLIDHIEHRTVNLSRVSILILDEADRMLDMGFKPQINRILKSVPKERQTMLFSATMPDDIVRIATEHMKRPVRIEVAPPGTTAEHVEHELFVVNKDQKNRLLEALLVEYHGSILVFTRTRFAARRVARAAQRMGHTAADIHSDRTLAQRREALEGFKTGKYRVLVATDIASRGIDVNGIEVVINYDIPEKADDYVHRIGRTGRAGMSGKAISFATPDQGDEIEAIEHLASVHLPVSRLPALPPDRPRPEGDDDRRGGRQGGGFVRRDGRGGGGFGGSRGRDGGRRPPAGRQGDRRGGSSFSGSSSGGKRPPSGFGSSQPAVGQKPSGRQSGRTAPRPGQARNDSSQGGRRRGSDRPRPEQGQGGNRRGPQISDDLLGLSLWPDTPNLHGGLNRKPLDDKHRR
jgi:ATP-dependent RNA helicase RhlE